MGPRQFYLGTHQPGWLARAGVPLFVSHRRLSKLRRLPRATVPWALDSGGFTELSMHGRWTIGPAAYAAEVRRYRDEIGSMTFAAPQDWMCEPHVTHETGLDVPSHQQRTVDNYLDLLALAPDLPWIPVVQGWEAPDYWRCVELYAARGVDLSALPLVGVGTVCRRQALASAREIVHSLASLYGLRLHGFGFKKQGIARCTPWLASADSMAWSYAARRRAPMPGHALRHKRCNNCLEFALEWRAGLPQGWIGPPA
jgi:hypothetical protein